MRRALIKAAPNMDADSLEFLKNGIHGHFGSDIEIETDVDESVIGGFIVMLDGTVYDHSVGTKLNNLKKFIKE